MTPAASPSRERCRSRSRRADAPRDRPREFRRLRDLSVGFGIRSASGIRTAGCSGAFRSCSTPGSLLGLGTQHRFAERAFAYPRWFRRLRIRREIRDDVHEAFLTVGCTLIRWRRLTARSERAGFDSTKVSVAVTPSWSRGCGCESARPTLRGHAWRSGRQPCLLHSCGGVTSKQCARIAAFTIRSGARRYGRVRPVRNVLRPCGAGVTGAMVLPVERYRHEGGVLRCCFAGLQGGSGGRADRDAQWRIGLFDGVGDRGGHFFGGDGLEDGRAAQQAELFEQGV